MTSSSSSPSRSYLRARGFCGREWEPLASERDCGECERPSAVKDMDLCTWGARHVGLRCPAQLVNQTSAEVIDVVVGHSVVVPCDDGTSAARGRTRPQWTFIDHSNNTKQVTGSDGNYNVKLTVRGELNFTRIAMSDHGKYRCTVNSTVMSTILLNVTAPMTRLLTHSSVFTTQTVTYNYKNNKSTRDPPTTRTPMLTTTWQGPKPTRTTTTSYIAPFSTTTTVVNSPAAPTVRSRNSPAPAAGKPTQTMIGCLVGVGVLLVLLVACCAMHRRKSHRRKVARHDHNSAPALRCAVEQRGAKTRRANGSALKGRGETSSASHGGGKPRCDGGGAEAGCGGGGEGRKKIQFAPAHMASLRHDSPSTQSFPLQLQQQPSHHQPLLNSAHPRSSLMFSLGSRTNSTPTLIGGSPAAALPRQHQHHGYMVVPPPPPDDDQLLLLSDPRRVATAEDASRRLLESIAAASTRGELDTLTRGAATKTLPSAGFEPATSRGIEGRRGGSLRRFDRGNRPPPLIEYCSGNSNQQQAPTANSAESHHVRPPPPPPPPPQLRQFDLLALDAAETAI